MTEDPAVSTPPATSSEPTSAAPTASSGEVSATPATEPGAEASATLLTEPSGPSTGASSPADSAAVTEQSSLATPRGLSYAVDIVFCIDVTGSMTPIIDQVKANALRFYDDVQCGLSHFPCG